ncbi:competence protein CoiA family protein [Cupriavidus nantongensis]|uniref:competence protein CoiA family protein n=1 Tax=Cupriavidus nantongensis TaxID=1796606 RepID=UPI00224726A5|nr:hypothetical protein [Cupriavidus nantongensis]
MARLNSLQRFQGANGFLCTYNGSFVACRTARQSSSIEDPVTPESPSDDWMRKSLAISPSTALHVASPSTLTFAVDASGVLRHVDAVANGKACGCVCPACKEPVIARQGALRSHSFAHDSGAECRWAQEAVLHHLAQHLIAARGEFLLPGADLSVKRFGTAGLIHEPYTLGPQMIRPAEVRLEPLLFLQRPNVILTLGERHLIVAIALTHKVGPSKLPRLKELGHAAIQINLTCDRPTSVGALAALLFGDDPRKTWVYNAKHDALRANLMQRCETRYQAMAQAEMEARSLTQLAVSMSRVASGDRSSSQPFAGGTRFSLPESPAQANESQGLRYKSRSAVLVAYPVAYGAIRVSVLGGPVSMRRELERESIALLPDSYLLAKPAWYSFTRRHGLRLDVPWDGGLP